MLLLELLAMWKVPYPKPLLCCFLKEIVILRLTLLSEIFHKSSSSQSDYDQMYVYIMMVGS